MSEPLDVTAIRAALVKATPAIWWHTGNGEDWAVFGPPGLIAVTNDQTDADAELIVLLRNNAEALLDAAEVAQVFREQWEDALDGQALTRDAAHEALAEKQAELERAQAASEGVDMLVAQAERRGAVKALRAAAEDVMDNANDFYGPSARQLIEDRANAIENGADL